MYSGIYRNPRRATALVAFRADQHAIDHVRHVVQLAQALNPKLRSGDVLEHAVRNLGRSLRQQLRARGIDPDDLLRCVEQGHPPAPFRGLAPPDLPPKR
jgi:hypothetical protein